MYLIAADNSDDNVFYTQIRTLDKSTTPNATIDSNPLFIAAERQVLAAFPNLALPDGRSQPNRNLICEALPYFAVANLVELDTKADGTSDVATSGEVRSQSTTMGPVTTRTEYTTEQTQRHSTTTPSSADRVTALRAQGQAILERYGAQSSDGDAVVQTRSRLSYNEDCPDLYDSNAIIA